ASNATFALNSLLKFLRILLINTSCLSQDELYKFSILLPGSNYGEYYKISPQIVSSFGYNDTEHKNNVRKG
ncbi:hypothetical protein KJ633_06210, partial [bacterium]|nr:hypothetical protein [bacterium]